MGEYFGFISCNIGVVGNSCCWLFLWKRKRYNLPKGDVELATSFENIVDNEEDINNIINNDRNLMIGKRLEDFLSKDEILSVVKGFLNK